MSVFRKIINYDAVIEQMKNGGMIGPLDVFLVSAIGLLLAGSVMVISGHKARLGAFLLLLFLIPTTFIFHFDIGNTPQDIQLMKNIGLMGGLLMIMAYGSGKWSMTS